MSAYKTTGQIPGQRQGLVNEKAADLKPFIMEDVKSSKARRGLGNRPRAVECPFAKP